LVYHYGQINAPVNDRYLRSTKALVSLLTLVRQYEKAGRQVEMSLSELEITKRSAGLPGKISLLLLVVMNEKGCWDMRNLYYILICSVLLNYDTAGRG